MKSIIKKNFRALCVYYLLSDKLRGMMYKSGNIFTNSGTTHKNLSLMQSINYIKNVFHDYKKYSGVERFYGTIAEVGPGDNCGVGLLFLADGCEKVDLIDRFYSARNERQQSEIYRFLINDNKGLLHLSGGVNLYDETTFPGLTRFYGEKARAEEFFSTGKLYDFIVSRSVLEHLCDPMLAIIKMSNALNEGGQLIHKVDLRDHDMFSSYFHELKYLEISDRFYPHMVEHSGRPNRIFVSDYKYCLERTGLDYKIIVTRLFGVGEIKPHLIYESIPSILRDRSLRYIESVKCNFAQSFKDKKSEDLSVAGFYIVARKNT